MHQVAAGGFRPRHGASGRGGRRASVLCVLRGRRVRALDNLREGTCARARARVCACACVCMHPAAVCYCVTGIPILWWVSKSNSNWAPPITMADPAAALLLRRLRGGVARPHSIAGPVSGVLPAVPGRLAARDDGRLALTGRGRTRAD